MMYCVSRCLTPASTTFRSARLTKHRTQCLVGAGVLFSEKYYLTRYEDGSGPSVPPKRVRFGKLFKGKARAQEP